jgi:hypothetical protein
LERHLMKCRFAGALLGLGLLGATSMTGTTAPGSMADPSEVAAVVSKFKRKDPGMAKVFARAYGYVIFPTVGKGGIGLGAARGKGYVYERASGRALDAHSGDHRPAARRPGLQ